MDFLCQILTSNLIEVKFKLQALSCCSLADHRYDEVVENSKRHLEMERNSSFSFFFCATVKESYKLFQSPPCPRSNMNAIFFHFSCVSICNICLGNMVPSSHMHYQFPKHRKGILLFGKNFFFFSLYRSNFVL